MVMFAFGSSAWAQTPVEFTFYDPGLTTVGMHDQTKSGVTLSYYAFYCNYESYASANVYHDADNPNNNRTLKVSSANTIVKVEMFRGTTSDNRGSFGLNNYVEVNGKGMMTTGSQQATWTGEATELTFLCDQFEDTYLEKVIVYVDGEVEEEEPPFEGDIYDFTFDGQNTSWTQGDASVTATIAGGMAHVAGLFVRSSSYTATFSVPAGRKIVKIEFTKDVQSAEAAIADVGAYDDATATWTDAEGQQKVVFSTATYSFIADAAKVYVIGEAEEEEPEGLKEGNFYIYATDWTGEKIYLAPNADGTLGMVAFDDAADKTAYQWTLTAKNVKAKFRAGSYGDYSTENRDVDGFVIKNVKTSQYIVKGACYDSYPYWRIALSNEESAAHVYYTELQDGLYCLYDTDAPSAAEAYGESEWNSPHDYYGYLTTSGLTDSAYYIWTFAATDAYNPADKDVFIASLDENNKPQYFVTVSGDKAVADPNYEYDSYSSVAEFSLHQTETGYQLLSGGKYVAADGTISDAACEYTLTEGILFNDITAAWFILDKNGEELSTYSNNKWSKSELESALQAVTDAAIDRTKYPEALLKELDDAVTAAQNLNQFYDDYSNFASAIKSALTKIAEYVEGTYQVAPAAGFQGYIANGGYAGYYMAYVDGEVKAVQFDESKADNFVWEIEANGDNLYIKHAATGKYLGGVHHYNCTGFGHTDAQGGYTEWAPRHAPDFGDLAQAHAYTFPTNSYYDWTKPGDIDGYAIADGDPCYLPGYVGYGDNHFPYATIMDDNGEPNGVIYGENSMNNQKSSVWKFLQLEAPVALTPEVVANNVPEEAVATLMSVELTYNTEVKVADKTLVTFTDAKGQTIDGVSASIMSPTGKGADFKKIIVGFVGLENLASGTYTVTLAEGAVANRADDTKVAKAYSFSFTLDVPLPEYKTFALKSSTPANGATVQNITEATLVFDGNIGEITNAAAAVLTKDGVSAGNTYMEVATDVAGTITVAFDEALAAGTYTLTIPAETIWNEKYNAADANKGIYAGARCNDEIVITFTVEKADGINGLLLDGNAELYNLNGVRANANAKGVVVGKGIKVLRK